MGIGRPPADVGVGLAAGVAGTVATKVSSTVERKLRERDGSDAPAQAAAKMLGVAPPATKWGAQDVAIGVWHHLVHAAATGAAHALLDARR